MAFLSKVGNILRQSGAPKNMSSNLSASSPSIFQAIRCISSKLFIGGLSYGTDDQGLREAFGSYGEVVEARIIMDRETGRSRGFGLITYNSSEEASSAIQALDGQDLHGRRVRVNYATERASGGGFGGGGFGGGGSNYGGGGGYTGGGGYGGEGNNGYGGGNSGYGGGNSGYGGGNYGGGSYGDASGGGNYASGGGNNYNSMNNGGGNYGVAGGVGGSDTYAPAGGLGDANQFDTAGSGSMGGGVAEGFNRAEPRDINFRDDDDEPDNFAKTA